MLRINTAKLESVVTLDLEGRVVGPWVRELENSCNEILNGGARLRLDLARVTFVNAEGIELLQRLRSSQVALSNCPLFVAEQLRRSAGRESLQ